MELIPMEDRSQYRCHFCLSEQSVKYFVEVTDPCESDEPTTVACCNKCALLYLGGWSV